MFTLHNGGSRTANRSLAEAKAHELDFEQSNGPLDGELADLYAATFIIVPVAILMKLFLF